MDAAGTAPAGVMIPAPATQESMVILLGKNMIAPLELAQSKQNIICNVLINCNLFFAGIIFLK